MADLEAPKPDREAYGKFIRAQAESLRKDDKPPASRKDWDARPTGLRDAMLKAMGTFPDKPCPLDPKLVDGLSRKGYRIEKLLFQSRPDVWVTANAYVSEATKERRPAVLVVHGHWPWARRDPVVQARCLGLMHLGFFVLAVDAFGAGELYPEPAKGTYHGALFGSTLWPAGLTLLGQQVYDNHRAVDYLLTRSEVDSDRLGITGASGGGNQTMYAGAMDDRFRAVVPVCSVGTYQAYLQAACCVCEVLPGALRFTEEGDVLGMVAPRALKVISADQDAFQFSVGEAKKSLERARTIYKLHNALDKVDHAVFASQHDYNQPMREAMYGWMTKWLKDQGEGKPIPEPAHQLEKPEDLACFPDKVRPKGFLFPPTLAAREARGLLARMDKYKPDHAEQWEAMAVHMRSQLLKDVFGDFPKATEPTGKLATDQPVGKVRMVSLQLQAEPGLSLAVQIHNPAPEADNQKACIVLHLDGLAKAVEEPLGKALADGGWTVCFLNLRATGDSQPEGDLIHDAVDHNSAEHGIWIGRPLLGQWVFDILRLLEWLGNQPRLDKQSFTVAGIGPAGIVALCAGALLDDRVARTIVVDMPTSYISEKAYEQGMHMGLLAPGILRVVDIPNLAALLAPRRLIMAGGFSPSGQKLDDEDLQKAFRYTTEIFKLVKAAGKLTIGADMPAPKLIEAL
ncbi:MAG: dienelactone hydrolase family protein [Gemmataceae bacterium]